MSAGDVAAARKALETAKTTDPTFLSALALAELDRREGRMDEARQCLIGVLTADPKNVPALLSLASFENDAGNRDAAIARYRAVLDIDGSNIFALNNLAYALALDDTDQALRLAQKALEVAPDNATVQDTMGWVYYRKGNYSTAVNYLKTAVGKEPTPRREFHLAMSYLKSGAQDVGQKMLQEALQQDPNLPRTEKGWSADKREQGEHRP
jgi:tetratricopeptide (TPR) repeat protein